MATFLGKSNEDATPPNIADVPYPLPLLFFPPKNLSIYIISVRMMGKYFSPGGVIINYK